MLLNFNFNMVGNKPVTPIKKSWNIFNSNIQMHKNKSCSAIQWMEELREEMCDNISENSVFSQIQLKV